MLRFGYSPSRGCLFESCPRPADLGIIGLPDTLYALAGWGDFARAPNPSPLRVAIAEVSAGLEPAAAFTGKPIQCGTFCRSFPAVILLRASRRTARNTIINMKRYSALKARKPLPSPEAAKHPSLKNSNHEHLRLRGALISILPRRSSRLSGALRLRAG